MEDARLTEHEVRSLISQVEAAVCRAMDRVRSELAGADPVVRRSEHADFQSNAALALAKRTRTRPAELAAAMAEALRADASTPVAEVTVSGPGFLNLTLAEPALWRQVTTRLASPRLGVGSPEQGRRTVIDYSGPNIAKEMHVGHLRTTVIGDCLARVLGFLGADVIRQNHLGDWGTQFGMLIQYLDDHPNATWRHDQLTEGTSTVSALDNLYRAARAAFDADPAFADRARARVVALQAGDEATVARWREIVAESEFAFREIYQELVEINTTDSVGDTAKAAEAMAARLRAAGLVDVAADAYFPITGAACTELELATVEQIRGRLVASEIATPPQIDEHLANVASGGLLDLATSPMITAWGRSPPDNLIDSRSDCGADR